MDTPDPPLATSRRSVVEAVVASTVGTTIEWYDFFLFGLAAVDVFPPLFFPSDDPFVSQISTFLSLALGFVARPLGGALFGYLGDRVGRKSTLVATLLLMGVSTFLVGLMPTYSQIGVAAPLLITLLRILQGLGVGGEWGGAVLLAVETGHRGKRGFYGSWPQAGVPLGLLLSAGVSVLCKWLMGKEGYAAGGWRLPFYLSGLLIVVGLLIRVRVMETPLFRQLQQSRQTSHAPLLEVVRGHWREILLAAGSRIAEQSCFYLFSLYVVTYSTTVLELPSETIFLAINVAAGIEFFTIPLFGLLSDHFTRRRIYVLGCLFLAAFAFPYFALLHTRDVNAVFLAVIVSLVVGHAMLYSVQASLIPELFGTRLRYSGASLGYQLASPFAGGLAPIIAATLVNKFPGQYWPLAVYVIAVSLFSLVCVQMLAETSRRDLS
jgi:MHS family shikimate/dehydroshikimate transporter-like MFS transporter